MAWVATSNPFPVRQVGGVRPARGASGWVTPGGAEDPRPGVLLAAPGRAGVQRAVADDLQRSHRQLEGAREGVAAAVPGGDDLVEPIGVRRARTRIRGVSPGFQGSAQSAASPPARDRRCRSRRGRLPGRERAAVRRRARDVGDDDEVDAGVGVVPLVLENHAVARRQVQPLERPQYSATRGDRRRRPARPGRRARPRRASRGPSARSSKRYPGGGRSRPAGARGDTARWSRTRATTCSGDSDPGQVEHTLPTRGPLGEVDVVVPQAWDQPAAVTSLAALSRACPRRPCPVEAGAPPAPQGELDDPDVAEDEVGHGVPRVAHGVRDVSALSSRRAGRTSRPIEGTAQTWRRDWTTRKREAT